VILGLAQGEISFPVHSVRLELYLYCFPNDAFDTCGFLGQDNGVIKVDVVTQINAVLCHS